MQIPGYKIERLIAEGGMASVYLAVQESLDRPVALKLLRKFDNPAQAARFFNEGKIIASFNHRNIITIYDLGAVGERHYLAMEFLHGGDLTTRIKQGMTPQAALDLLETLSNCLSFVHKKGIIHRDIKPENILFRKDGTAVLTDFGVAKLLESDTSLTMDGTALGSPHYLSPEQAESKPLDGRADIYSLGVVFYEMLTGKKPFQGDSAIEIIISHLTAEIPDLPTHLRAYQNLLSRMTAKDPADRFASVEELAEAIQQTRLATTKRRFVEASAPQIAPSMQSSAEVQAPSQRFAIPGIQNILRNPSFKTAAIGAFIVLSLVIAAISGFFVGNTPDTHPDAPPAPQLKTSRHPAADADAPVVATERPSVEQPPETQDSLALAGNTPLQTDTASDELPTPITETSTDPNAAEKPPQPQDPLALAKSDPLKAAAIILNEKPLTKQKLTQAYNLYRDLEIQEPHNLAAKQGIGKVFRESLKIDKELNKNLALASAALKDGRLAGSGTDNAAAYYRDMLLLDNEHPEALQGLGKIAELYAGRAEADLNRNDTAAAEQNVRLGLSVQADHPRLLALAAKLNIATGDNGKPSVLETIHSTAH